MVSFPLPDSRAGYLGSSLNFPRGFGPLGFWRNQMENLFAGIVFGLILSHLYRISKPKA